MIGRLAVRSLTAHPIRSAILAAGFGVGVAVMAILLGVAEVVLRQAQSPDLAGGGDVVISLDPAVPAQLVLAGTLQADSLRSRIAAVSPSHTATVTLRRGNRRIPVEARGGIPSMQRALGDREVSQVANWSDGPRDGAWTERNPGGVLRQIDRFHAIPDAPAWQDSWAEWLYFNGRSDDARFYLTLLVGPRTEGGTRTAGVRLQLDRHGQVENFGTAAVLTDEDVQRAPELRIGRTRVTLDGLRYIVDVDLGGRDTRHVTGRLVLQASAGRLIPPIEITGARNWRTGYVVPVMSGALSGALDVNGTPVSFDRGTGYHDHNWGFWRGVSWQWGQTQQGDLSLIYGRVFPPADAADADRIPGFVGVLGPDGPLGYATNVRIAETNDTAGRPTAITITGRSPLLDVTATLHVESQVATSMSQGPLANGVDFLQLRGTYAVTGTARGRNIRLSGPGAAETFRARPAP